MGPTTASNQSKRHTRGEFFSSATGLAAMLGSAASANGQQVPAPEPGEGLRLLSQFPFGKTYSSEEVQRLLRPPRGFQQANTARVGLPFWWDRETKMLVNPFNNHFDSSIKPGDYKLDATVLNFRASREELGDVWERMDNNCQLNINPKSVSSEGDRLEWILMTGINVAQSLFSARDGQLATLTQNNKPTEALQKSEAVVFKKGNCTLGITINAQRKKSVWDILLSTVKKFAGSAVFGVLPIPKLYQTAIQSVTAALDQLTTQSRVIQVLGGRSYEYRLYEGTTKADLVFRPGHWVVLDSEFAAAHMDRDRNLAGVYLDIPGLLYQLKDANGQRVDTTYTVLDLKLDPVTNT